MSFLETLQQAKKRNGNVVIPDIKCVSPKEGDLLEGRNPVEVAKMLVKAGAPVLSVVTEEKNFGGSEELLSQICRETKVPVLRKDFLHTREDMVRTKELGASAVLLMYSCLEPEHLERLYHDARELGLDVLVETHTEEEMFRAKKLGARMIGINNRNIKVLEKDGGNVSLTQQMAAGKPADAFLISESSLQSPEDVRRAILAGADAALVGTAIWKAEDPQLFYRLLCNEIQVKLCGMMNKEGINICAKSGAEILGFVVEYPENVPWNLSREDAAVLMSGVHRDVRTCVVTGGSIEKVVSLAKMLHPSMIQLHHKESLDETIKITEELTKMGIDVIRSIPTEETGRMSQFGTADFSQIARKLAEGGVKYLLMDSREPANASQKSSAAPLSQYEELSQASPIPVILAGGITAENVLQVLKKSKASNIDVMTGIETSPGKKSKKSIESLFNAINTFHK